MSLVDNELFSILYCTVLLLLSNHSLQVKVAL
jgi:hypothetical protein